MASTSAYRSSDVHHPRVAPHGVRFSAIRRSTSARSVSTSICVGWRCCSLARVMLFFGWRRAAADH